jgi:hypothetical protein
MVEAYTDQYGYTELAVGIDTLCLRHFLGDAILFDEEYYTPNLKSPGSVNEKNDDADIPAAYIINQNYPSSFNPPQKAKFL